MEVFRTVVTILSAVAIPALMLVFLVYGAMKKVKVYEAAVEGAKEGFTIAVKIIPYLVLMLVAIAVFRASGAMDVLISAIRPVTDLIGLPAETLPMALMRPLSGSGSLGIMTETMKQYGTDSFIGTIVSTMYGSTHHSTWLPSCPRGRTMAVLQRRRAPLPTSTRWA